MNVNEKFMKLALRLARKGIGMTSPNPPVGAVIVKGNRILGRGYHKKSGGPHAEVFAFRQTQDAARGARLYVTLEPCCHFGKTPPCTDAIIKSGIDEVIVACLDPNPLNNGKGIKRLQKSGIKVTVGVLEEEANRIIEPFKKYITKGLPFVSLKMAETLDGKIATISGDSKWVTGEPARNYVHKLRSEVDAVMVGANTVLRDNPLLTCRNGKEPHRQPARIIVDSKLRLPSQMKVFCNHSPVIIAAVTDSPKRKAEAFEKKGVMVLTVKGKSGKVALRALMKRLAKEFGITSIMIEGGGELAASALNEGLVDKCLFFISPSIIGGRDAITPVEGEGIAKMSKAIRLRDVRLKRFGEDILVEGHVA
ncbi:MAG: bifunctional diaminohydroxyphosphoribosylaminopyrimidine deaminase/5-amino-6-(5-phosphoribosylamino)uracil reductase RibD [Candidatus Omnitrophica bacterium]|nr:bifunctional diaminohydroxyphosphoribosylaminopyrimidine deaminase/5-amino-6-(5-phosphoribosylamino)uracil reductase RibD [Candidatus Omnitrophota bacterium]